MKFLAILWVSLCFLFFFFCTNVSEEELKIADELKNKLKKTREELGRNIDKSDIEFIELYEELRR